MYLESTPAAARWQPAPSRSVVKSESNELKSSLAEIVELLQFDGRIPESADLHLFSRRRLAAGQTALRMGQPFEGIYVVRLGALKTTMTHVNGGEHVLTFPMKGDLVGYDGAFKNQYLSEVTALTDCELIKIPVTDFFSPGRGCNDVERMAYWAISREIAQEQSCYASSHSAKSDTRVARFLRLQSDRFANMGYSPTRFTLPMTRRDIGNHLDVTLETVSRAFSAMDRLGIISVDRREVHIHSLEALSEFEQ